MWCPKGYPQFEDLIFRRGELFFVAFDVLLVDGEDLRQLPLIERKVRLKTVVPSRQAPSRLRYHSHVQRYGKALYQLTCERDLNGSSASIEMESTTLDGPPGRRSRIRTTLRLKVGLSCSRSFEIDHGPADSERFSISAKMPFI
jgi:ATP dependent DNA ligase-like protein